MSLVYSYIRFSTFKQMAGDSFRRQTEQSEEWISRNKHTAATLRLHDLGVSAFRGRNKETGALRAFLDAIRDEVVKPGSILLVENLDRLSRQGVAEAYELFTGIIRSGVKIAVLRPQEIVYDASSLNDITGLMLPLLYFHLASTESKNKSDRLRKVWQHKREDAATGKKFDTRRPSWIDWDKDKKLFILNDGAKAIRQIFELTAAGFGQRQVVRQLQKSHKPIGKCWNSSFIQAVLASRTVLGERQSYAVDDNGDRQPIGPPIVGYYPAVIDEALWTRANASKTQRKKQKGPNSQFVNLFTGIVLNAHDGKPMHAISARCMRENGQQYLQRRLVSYGHLRHENGSDPVSVDYHQLENTVLRYLSEISPEDLAVSGAGNALKERQQEKAGVEQRLTELTAALSDPKVGSISAVILALGNLEKRRAELAEQIEQLQMDRPLEHAHGLIAALASAEPEQLQGIRLRLRGLIADLLESVIVKPEKHLGRVFALIQLNFRSGLSKQVDFGPGFRGGLRVQEPASDYLIDLRDRKKCKRILFRNMAEMLAEVPVVSDVEVPALLGPAAEAWLTVARGRMTRASFRVVPSKVRRFVQFIGPHTPVRTLGAEHWKLFVRWVRLEMRDKRLARTTARILLNRVREFLRWLSVSVDSASSNETLAG